MNKNIIICCDGTSNKLADDHTNVVRIFQVAEKGGSQIAFYDPGVGTMAAPDQKTAIGKRWSLVKGLALGDGLDENVFEAYRYLMDVYEEDDRVFLFGYSRGAFAVRVLAGMLHGVGLLFAGSENLLSYCWESYRMIPTTVDTSPGHDTPEAKKIKRGVDHLRQHFTRRCPVEFLGVWDTVGSVGLYNWNQAFPFTFSNPGVKCVRHAVALDEKRAAFRSNVYLDKGESHANGSPKVMNVWFPGVHSDIGGGNDFEDAGLAMGAFQWMVAEAHTIGMQINPASFELLLKQCPPNPMAMLHESLTGAWKAIEYLPARRYNWAKHHTEWRFQPNKPRRMNVTKAYVHQSVLERVTKDGSYWPASLPKMTVEALKEQFPIVADQQIGMPFPA